MAITAETRTGIITLSVAMLGSAPGTAQLSEWVEAVDEGMTLEDLANHIASSSAFKALYPVFQTNEDFAMYFLGNVFGGEVAADALEAAADIVVGVLESGTSRGEVALMVVGALHDIAGDPSHAAQGAFGMAAANLANKTEVAEYYVLGGEDRDAAPVASSESVLDGVTSDMATVGKAKHDLDSPAADAMFGEVGDLSIDENMASGSVGMVMASDPNHTGMYPDPVAYSLKDAPDGFSIDENSGEISYMGAGLDHEATPTIELTVVATSTGADGTPTGVEQMVTVMVGDVSEEGPAFGDVGEFKLYEHTSGAGEGNAVSVGKITAEDADGDPVTYTIKDNPEGWAILADGKLCYVGEGIDYETTTSVDLTIVATSTGDGSKDESVEQHITVDIVDRNDAMFGDPDLMPLKELMSGMDTPIALGRVMAMDADEGDEITYSLKGNAVDAENPGLLHTGFAIDASTGALSYTGQGIHNSISSSVKLTVIATSTGDNGMATPVEQEVTIDIKAREDAKFGDVGDLMIMENDDGSVEGNPVSVGHVTASDADGDSITYSIKGDPEGWAILDGGKLCYVGEGLDYETTPTVDLTIIATSVGANGEATPVEQDVTVMVGNLNDNAPTWGALTGEATLVSGTLEEDATTGVTISFLDADGDVGEYSATVHDAELIEGGGYRYASAVISTRFKVVADANDPMSFSLVAIGGAEIEAGEENVVVRFSDGENAISRRVKVTASDAPVAPEPPKPSEDFELTTRTDRIQGGAGDDMIVATSAAPSAGGNDAQNSAADTLSPLDNIDGGGGHDTLDLSSVNAGGYVVPSTVRVANVETLVVNTVGSFEANLGSWKGMENINLQIIGNKQIAGGDTEDVATDDHFLALDLNANGAAVTSEVLNGTVCIQNALTVDLAGVSKASDVKIASGKVTTAVSVSGGRNVQIGAGFGGDDEDGRSDENPFPDVVGRSGTITSVSVDKAVGAISVNSDALNALSLGSSASTATVTSGAQEKVDLTVSVSGFGTSRDNPLTARDERAEATLNLMTVAGRAGFSQDLDLVVEGASFFTLVDADIKKLAISGDSAVELSIEGDNEAVSTTLESIAVSGAAGLTMNGGRGGDAQTVTGFESLGSIDGSKTSGAIKLTIADNNIALSSIKTGSGKDVIGLTSSGDIQLRAIATGAGDDRVDVSESHRTAGLSVDLGSGNDTYVAKSAGNGNSDIKGGSGTDTLNLRDGDWVEVDVTDEGSKVIYSSFEMLDVGGGEGDYNMDRLYNKVGIRDVKATANTAGEVTLQNVRAGTDVTVTKAAVEIAYQLEDSGGRSDSVDLDIEAVGGIFDRHLDLTTPDITRDRIEVTGESSAVFTANGIETVRIDSTAKLHALNGGVAKTSDYSNSVTLEANKARTLDLGGDAKLVITGDFHDALTLVDARDNSAGVNVDASSAAALNPDNDGQGRGITFRGGAAKDIFKGGAGDDLITGGAGGDDLTGGGGADTFRFDTPSHSRVSFSASGAASGFDTIQDFNSEDDELLIRGASLSRTDLDQDILDKEDVTDPTPDGSAANDLRDFIGDGEDFFIDNRIEDDPVKHAIAAAESDAGLYVFIDVNGNGDFDSETDMVILLAGQTDLGDVSGSDFITTS